MFWWILYCDMTQLLVGQLLLCCFNPCFGGSYIVTIFSLLFGSFLPKFQSLFWWILYCDKDRLCYVVRGSKFQSLFWWILYCDFSSLPARCWIIPLFQSLFWWILYCDNRIFCCIWVCCQFQSLFWWILYCDCMGRGLVGYNAHSFNPCFGGSYIVTITLVVPRKKRNLVSILVLVDLILWRCNSNFPVVDCLVSILVLVDLILWLYVMTNYTTKDLLFQSLFWWILYCDYFHFRLMQVFELSFNPCFGGSYIVTALIGLCIAISQF